MISMMEMTTGQWEIDSTVPDARIATGDSLRGAFEANLPLHAGLCEHEAARPIYAGMPLALVTWDLDEFISRMDGAI